MIAGGGALLILYERQGATASFLAMAALTALASVPVAAAREPSPVPGAAAGAGAAGIGAIARFFRRPGAGRLLAVIVTYKVGDAFATSMLRPFLADSGMGLADVGWLLGTVGFLAGLAGALGGGALVGRLGRRRALLLFGLFQAISVAAYAGLAAGAPPRAAIYVVCAVEHAAGGMATAALFTCMMDWCSREWGATDYTVQASAVVVSTGVASALAGWSAQHLGYFAHFCLAAAVGLGGLLVVRLVFPRSRAAQLRGPEEPSDAIPTEVVP
jgi:predicted MFS family arabinose efflux permease